MKEYTCIVCGAKGIDSSHTGNRKFCSKECSAVHWRQTHGFGANVGESCFFNEGVVCEDHKCVNCGWNPAVIKLRKEAMLCPTSTG
jgi:hypothetical protein